MRGTCTHGKGNVRVLRQAIMSHRTGGTVSVPGVHVGADVITIERRKNVYSR